MKFKFKFVVLLFLSLGLAQAFAATEHAHSKKQSNEMKMTAKSVQWPGNCEITIINNSYDDLNVYGIFDDGERVGFNVYRNDPPHHVSLFYYGYCHYDMFLDIVTFSGYPVYSGYPTVDTVIEIVPWWASKPKAEIKSNA